MPSGWLSGVAITIAGALAFWGAVVLVRRLRRQRMKAAARAIGLRFRDLDDHRLMTIRRRFNLFLYGDQCDVTNVLTGTIEDLNVFIFDYRAKDSRDERLSERYVVVAFELPAPSLPRFELRPHEVFSWDAPRLDGPDLEFSDHPSFTDHYTVRGPDEAMTRLVLDADALDHLVAHAPLGVEGDRQWLVVYRRRFLLAGLRRPRGQKQDHVKTFLAAAFTFCTRVA